MEDLIINIKNNTLKTEQYNKLDQLANIKSLLCLFARVSVDGAHSQVSQIPAGQLTKNNVWSALIRFYVKKKIKKWCQCYIHRSIFEKVQGEHANLLSVQQHQQKYYFF